MKRALRLLSLWDWLPTFRAVAEREHISKAAAELGVSPSAVSRMIGLLEADVGRPLFDRVGRSVRLNPAGEHLLRGVRSAMRLVDESLSHIEGTQFVGPLRIATTLPIVRAFLLPALARLRGDHGSLVPSIRTASAEQVTAMLLEGDIDVGFVAHITPRQQVAVERLGVVAAGVYCGSGHPLHGASPCSMAEVVAHPFVTTPIEVAAGWWPEPYRRESALSVEDLEIAAEICAQGELLCVLPDDAARRARERLGSDLHQLPLDAIRPTEVFAVWRERLELPGRAEALIAAVRAVFAELDE